MPSLHRHALITLLGLMLCGGPVRAADSELNANALNALQRMGTYLRSLTHFRISASSHTDQILDSGQTLEFSHRTELQAVQPDKLQITVSNGELTRSLYYNGQTFVLYNSRHGYFARSEAPPRIDQLLDQLNERYGIELPLADLFRWNSTTAAEVGIDTALYIGSEQVDGETCTHYAYRQPDIDWQLWVRDGDQPLPCRLVISRRDLAEQPRHSVDFHWDLKRPSPASAFEFNPPAGALAVPLRALDAAQPGLETKP
ncbi:DUF2092 domain-containing protein [Pseudomonas gingeri]|uniref:DUF2092 domain-containing protein n=1 Tax=Pseudomonas gingeri TaxID=117681 RepID=UPI0015A0DCAC|nr:DUF2092 domain-containing protein [Pseudomonas gingeri]NWA05862.1 DUF2092 domain-containing protein [Pseudomonas gingeri]